MENRYHWVRTKRSLPCPVCARIDYCSISPEPDRDGNRVVNCTRTPTKEPIFGRGGEWVGYLHRIPQGISAPLPKFRPIPEMPRLAPADIRMNNEEFKAALDQEKLFRLSGELGVSAESLYRLQIGWHPREMCFTFPCFGAPFGPNSLVGIERRYHDGKKKVIAGTSGGLFIPTGLSGSKREPLLIEEGASSTAALLDMGFDAIGRFNCNSGVALILAYISKMVGRSIVIVANADEQKFRPDGSSFYPGQDGGDILAAAAVELGHSVKRIVLPNHVNDSREFRKKGATKDMMLSVIRQWPVLTAEGCAA